MGLKKQTNSEASRSAPSPKGTDPEDSGRAGISPAEALADATSTVSDEDKALVAECEQACLDDVEEDAVKAALLPGYKLYQRLLDATSGEALTEFVQARVREKSGQKQLCHLKHLLAIYLMAGRPTDTKKKAKRQDWANSFICAAKESIRPEGFSEWVKKRKLKDFREQASQIREEEKVAAEKAHAAKVAAGKAKERKPKPAPKPYLMIGIRGTGNRGDEPSIQVDISPDDLAGLKEFLAARKEKRQNASVAREAIDLLHAPQVKAPPLAPESLGSGLTFGSESDTQPATGANGSPGN